MIDLKTKLKAIEDYEGRKSVMVIAHQSKHAPFHHSCDLEEQEQSGDKMLKDLLH